MMEKLLSDMALLYQKFRNYHWNVTGPGFMQLHKFLEDEYDALAEEVDEVAELVRMKGEKPLSTYKEFLANARLKEGDKDKSKDEMVQELIKDYEQLLGYLKQEFNGDVKTEDLLTGIIARVEKSIWLMRASL
ncbi:DNA starvation/stationary phase protection protein [Candidatus Woesearchaeota archaeon]|nr:DNA starvation/stationary phase protection protein [Candidatus Woesearchaeota archaeon]